ncbi:MAG: putative GTP-binding protein EngB [Chlamydiae bacterium]|nr:putative GTP-binding protein EngB [Chlamydiota bacterium]
MKKLVFKTISFVKSCSNWNKSPSLKDDQGESLFEIAVAGRSNVGKSSLLNDLFRSKNLVKTSSKPGKTRLLNFFDVDKTAVFCDLPGYGFAKVSEKMRNSWRLMIEPYLEKREELKLVLLLLDIRRNPSEQDLQFFEWVQYQKKPILIVFTKVDKVKKNEKIKQMKKNIEKLNSSEIPFVYYSTTKNVGRKELIFEINRMIELWG